MKKTIITASLAALLALGFVGSIASGGGTVITAPVGQKRVTGTCASPNAIGAVNADGSVTCNTTGTGDITSVTVTSPACAAGTFMTTLTGGATSGDAPVGGTCTAEVGDISSVVAGTSMTGGATSGAATLNVSLPGASCSAGQVVTAISAAGTGTCTAIGTAGGVTGTGTSKLAVWNSSTSITDYAGASSCSAGSFFTGFSAAGASTCTATGLTGLTTNRTVKALSGTTIGDAWADEDGTTWGRASKFTITESTGAFHGYSTGTVDGMSTLAGITNTANTIRSGSITATPSTTQNDWTPTGLSTASVIEVSPSANTTLTGLTAQTTGTEVVLRNSHASRTVTLSDQNASSTAANRFDINGNLVMQGYQSITLRYNGTFWEGVGHGGGSVLGIAQANVTTAVLGEIRTQIASNTTTGTQNDTNASGTTTFTWNGSADSTITGFLGGAQGRLLVVQNVTAAKNLTLAHDNAGSASGRRIKCPASTDLVLGPTCLAVLSYDTNQSYWMVASHACGTNSIPTTNTGATTFTSTKNAGSITLSGGTGTATVVSGMHCACSDTSANASVQCAVSTTTLTATGTGTDVISYVCM